jgi:hypothetical protein
MKRHRNFLLIMAASIAIDLVMLAGEAPSKATNSEQAADPGTIGTPVIRSIVLGPDLESGTQLLAMLAENK